MRNVEYNVYSGQICRSFFGFDDLDRKKNVEI